MKDSYIFYKDKLKGEYKDAFEQIELYVNSQSVDTIVREDRLSSLIDSFLLAQEEEKPVRKIVGDDIKSFCRLFCSDMGTKNKILNILDIIRNIAWFELVLALGNLFYFDWSTLVFWTAGTDFNAVGYFLAISVGFALSSVIHAVVRRLMFNKRKINMNLLKGIFYFSLGAIMVLQLIIFGKNQIFIKCPLWLVIALSMAYLAVYYILNFKRFRDDKREKISFFEKVNEESNQDFEKVLLSRFERINKRNRKKGKPEISMEEFLEKEEKDCVTSEKIQYVFLVIPVVMTVNMYFTGQFENGIIDMAIFFVMCFAIEYFLWKTFKSSIDGWRTAIKNLRNSQNGEE